MFKEINGQDILKRQRAWEAKLLDITDKNTLINFKAADSVRLNFDDALQFSNAQGSVFRLCMQTGTQGKDIAQNSGSCGILRGYSHNSMPEETLKTLIKRGKLAEAELGSSALYISLGLLSLKGSGGAARYAPVALMPVSLIKEKSGGVKAVRLGGVTINHTLVEFLRRERGISVDLTVDESGSAEDILNAFRERVKGYKIAVSDKSYISLFRFSGYTVWRDLKGNMQKYEISPVVSKLLFRQFGFEDMRRFTEDSWNPQETLTPLGCDCFQYSAVAESLAGKSFVLHGPPGTGKSQTIANIIANSLYRGKRVLFVAEKRAALQVVKKRLEGIGIGDFCIELHGEEREKEELAKRVAANLTLKRKVGGERFEEICSSIRSTLSSLSRPYAALHRLRPFGISVYEGICRYFENVSAPDLIDMDPCFYRRLTADKIFSYEHMLISAQSAASECGGVKDSPFSGINLTRCDEGIKCGVVAAARSTLFESERLNEYLTLFLHSFGQRLEGLGREKSENLLKIIALISSGAMQKFLSYPEEELLGFFNANLKYGKVLDRWVERFGSLPRVQKLSKARAVIIKKLSRSQVSDGEELLLTEEITRQAGIILSYGGLSAHFVVRGCIDESKRREFIAPLTGFHKLCAATFENFRADSFNYSCIKAADGRYTPLLDGLKNSLGAFSESVERLKKFIAADEKFLSQGDMYGSLIKKCNSLIENIDMLSSWCKYRATVKKLNESGLKFLTDCLEDGSVGTDEILSSFRKNVYYNFVRGEMEEELDYCGFSATALDAASNRLEELISEYSALCRVKIYNSLVEVLHADESMHFELSDFRELTCGNMQNLTPAKLFYGLPDLMKKVTPCVLASPFAVSKYLPPDTNSFDLVIFDEASQMFTGEAIPSLGRAKSAVVAGDPKQMPPTAFFNSKESELPESILDECLAAGMPENYLVRHYRSEHESLIEFSNKSFYFSRLCTIPSADAARSRVELKLVKDGVYERGGSKCNPAEAKKLVEEVVARLKDEKLYKSSMGIVAFSAAQQAYIEGLLKKSIEENNLEERAYEREEPLFVKNLESVQGDERDVIFISVGYGPDNRGRVNLNFGPLNRAGGWRRLNVAASRARREMLVYSSMRYTQLNTGGTVSRGVASLRAFLEYAEKGAMPLAYTDGDKGTDIISQIIAKELTACGYKCRCKVGVSAFKIDVGVLNPAAEERFALAILCDGPSEFSVKDKYVTINRALKSNGWHIYRVYCANFFNNPKREIDKIKQYLSRILTKDIESATCLPLS